MYVNFLDADKKYAWLPRRLPPYFSFLQLKATDLAETVHHICNEWFGLPLWFLPSPCQFQKRIQILHFLHTRLHWLHTREKCTSKWPNIMFCIAVGRVNLFLVQSQTCLTDACLRKTFLWIPNGRIALLEM